LTQTLALTLWLALAALGAPTQPDPDMQRVLDAWKAFRGRPVQLLTASQARSQPCLTAAVPVVQRKLGKSTAPQPVASVRTTTVPGEVGDLPSRVYQPAGQGPFPVVVYFHGGGWVLGSIEDYDASARALANAAGAVVVSVGYRQAPEHPYPAPLKDAYAAFAYVKKNAPEFAGDKRRVAIAGEGSGANLAAAVCLMAMDLRGPMPIHQVLICPITDLSTDSPSFRSNAHALPYGKAAIQWFLSHYIAKKSDRQSPYISILKKPASDLPPATIIVAGLDPLASEGEAYHRHLLDYAVDSQIAIFKGVTADFFGTAAVVAKAKRAVDFTGQRLRKAFTINRPSRLYPAYRHHNKKDQTQNGKGRQAPGSRVSAPPAPAPSAQPSP
jgi:acetyl esterase/lipase